MIPASIPRVFLCRGRIGLLVAVAFFSACTRPSPAGPPRGGEHLLPAAERAARVVVGRIKEVRKVDLHGYVAWLQVERELTAGPASGERLRMAWEELAKGRAPRFRDGDLVLVALSALPNASLWDARFPGARGDNSVLAVAAEGQAYMLDPDAESLDLLEAYLRLPLGARAGSAGVTALGRLVAAAAPGLAKSALRRCAEIEGLRTGDAEVLQPLMTAVGDDDRPLSLRRAVLSLIGTAKMKTMRPALDPLAAPGSDLRAPALLAIAEIDGGLLPERVAELLASDDPSLRAVGARYATTADSEGDLSRLLESDPDARVRAQAATAVIRVGGIEAFGNVVPALGDEDPGVRLAAVQAVGGLGAPAVAPLTALAEHGSLAEATGAVLALDLCGAAGRTALITLASDHPDERVRNVALLALGKLGHGH